MSCSHGCKRDSNLICGSDECDSSGRCDGRTCTAGFRYTHVLYRGGTIKSRTSSATCPCPLYPAFFKSFLHPGKYHNAKRFSMRRAVDNHQVAKMASKQLKLRPPSSNFRIDILELLYAFSDIGWSFTT